MEQKIVFRQLLDELKELALISGNTLKKEEVEKYLEHVGLSAEQVDMVCAYLTDQKIRVQGFVDTRSAEQAGSFAEQAPEKTEQKERAGLTGAAEDGEENISSLEIYLEEIGQITQPDMLEELTLFHRVAAGDKTAKQQLAESMLPMICDLASELENEEILAEDLIQEGNMGLLLALEQLTPMESLAAYQAFVMNEVNNYLEEVCGASTDVRSRNEDMLRRVEKLNTTIEQLEKELERKVTAEELSAYLELPLEEIISILRLSGDQEA